MYKFWIVWNPSGAPATYKHPTAASAEKEAERLARQSPSCMFVVMEAVKSCRKTDIAWEDCKVDEEGDPFADE